MGMLDIATVVTGVNILLLISLAFVYVSNWLKLRSNFAMGLAFFSSMFLIQNIVALYCQLMMVEYYNPQISAIALALNTLEAFGLGILTYISWS